MDCLLTYDIQDYIIEYLDIESVFKFLQTCKNIYGYKYYDRYSYIMCKKISDYFDSFRKINLLRILKRINYLKYSKILYKFYIEYKNHPYTFLSEFLYELTDQTDDKLFENIIKLCYFTRNGVNQYNFIKSNDLQDIIINSNLSKLQLIKENISIPIEILEYSIITKIQENSIDKANLLIEYLFYKHFWRNSEYVQDKITTFIIKCILYNNKDTLGFIYEKRKHYRFLVNYNRVLTFIMSQEKIKYIDYIEKKRYIENNESKVRKRDDLIKRIIIKPEDISIMINNKNYKVLAKIIDIYLGHTINLKKYSIYIKLESNDLYQVFKEMNVLKYFNKVYK